jgi:hypothetical protein
MRRLPYLVLVAIVTCSLAYAEDLPTSLTCSSNAKAWRDWGFSEKQWGGTIPPKASQPFGVSTASKPDLDSPLRDKVFSALDTKSPMIRSITPGSKGNQEQAAEFTGIVVRRTPDAVFVLWSNENNKIWMAAIDLTHRKAVVSQVFQGVTSVGGDMETLDCR